MQIIVNQEPFEVTLEEERFLGEVVTGLSSWFSAREMHIQSMRIDDLEADINTPESWKKINIASVGTLSLEVISKLELHNQHLKTLEEYIRLFQQGLSTGNDRVVQDLLDEYPAVACSLDNLLNPGTTDRSFAEKLENLLEDLSSGSSERARSVQVLLDFLRNLEVLIRDRRDETENPAEELQKVLETLKLLVPILEELPVLLQTGKDSEAMHHVITFTELYGKLTRLFSFYKMQTGFSLVEGSAGEEVKRLSVEINPTLQELLEAFNTSDAVLIGDLIEYEVAPKMVTLCEALESRLKEIQGDALVR